MSLSVDIILPTYAGKRWLAAAVESVLGQSYPHWQLFLVDDASPDDTLAFAQARFGDQGGRLHYLGLEQGRRAPGARMAAIRQGQGALLAFIDQDDVWHAEKLARQVALLAQMPAVGLVHCDVAHIDAQGRLLPGSARRENAYRASLAYDSLPLEELARRVFVRSPFRLVATVVRRSAFLAVGGVEGLPFGAEEWGLWVRLLASGHRPGYLPQPLVYRRLHQGNVTSQQQFERNAGLWQGMAQLVAEYPSLAPYVPLRRPRLLRKDILSGLQAGQGAALRPKIRQYMALGSRRAGLGFLLLSYLGPLAGPAARRLVRIARMAGAP